MTCVDLLSDTTYPDQARRHLHQLLGHDNPVPVKAAQIYGLRQIARQQPGQVGAFANRQRGRAQNASEITFWTLVADLCSAPLPSWSVLQEGIRHLSEELQNIPEPWPGMTNEDRSRRNKLRDRRRESLELWKNEHIPAFFERFCTHALYLLGKE